MLGLDLTKFAADFVHDTTAATFLIARADPTTSQEWADRLGVAARRCYISDQMLRERAEAEEVAGSEIAAVKIPAPGSVMSGDFGEIVASFFLAAQSLPQVTYDALRWRYKADPLKAAPHSDVVQMILPAWPASSADDRILCAEVKAKATKSKFDPILKAGEGSANDRGGRLIKTLVWLRAKVRSDGSDTVTRDQLQRFIDAIDHATVKPEFMAIAVIDARFVTDEIARGIAPDKDDCTLIVMAVPELKKRYTELFDAIKTSADALAPPPAAEETA